MTTRNGPHDRGTLASLDDFRAACAKRQAMDPIPEHVADEVHRVPAVVRRLTPHAARDINEAAAAFYEAIGLIPVEPYIVEPGYLEDGRLTFAVVVTAPASMLNLLAASRRAGQAIAAADPLTTREATVLSALTDEWRTRAALEVACGLAGIDVELAAIVGRQLAWRTGGTWRRAKP